jgi:hypothetical protein
MQRRVAAAVARGGAGARGQQRADGVGAAAPRGGVQRRQAIVVVAAGAGLGLRASGLRGYCMYGLLLGRGWP